MVFINMTLIILLIMEFSFLPESYKFRKVPLICLCKVNYFVQAAILSMVHNSQANPSNVSSTDKLV